MLIFANIYMYSTFQHF